MSNYHHIKKIIDDHSIFNEPTNKIEIEKLDNGRTNQSFLLRCDFKKYVLRLNTEKTISYNIDRSLELKILNIIKNNSIGPKVIYCDDSYNFLVTEFIEGEQLSLKTISVADKKNLYDLIDRYQNIKLNMPKFNYLNHFKKYENFISKNMKIDSKLSMKLKFFYPRLEDFQNQNWKPVLCHHDLSSSNIIKTNTGLRIIDWEYSGFGHFNFDKEYLSLDKTADIFFSDFFEILKELWYLINKS